MKPVFILAAALLCSCASPHLPPQFVAPSTVPIQQAAEKIQKSAQTVEKHIDNATDIAKKIEAKVPEARPFMAALNKELFDSKSEIRTLEGTVAELKGANSQLDTQLKTMTKQANEVSDAYTHAQIEIKAEDAQIAKEHARGNKWLKRFLLAASMFLAAGGWIARKPLLAVGKAALPLIAKAVAFIPGV